MPPNDGNTLGSASVRITADTSDLNAKVDQAKAKVEQVGSAAQAAAKTAQQAWDEIASPGAKRLADNVDAANKRVAEHEAALKDAAATIASAGDATQDVSEKTAKYAEKLDTAEKKATKFSTAIRSITGGAAALGAAIVSLNTAVEAIGEYMGARWGDGGGAAGKLLDKLGSAKPEERLKAVEERLKAINNELAYKSEHPIFGLIAGTGEKKLLDEKRSLAESEAALRLMMIKRQTEKEIEDARKVAKVRSDLQRDYYNEFQQFQNDVVLAGIDDATEKEVASLKMRRAELLEMSRKDGLNRMSLILAIDNQVSSIRLKKNQEDAKKAAEEDEKNGLKRLAMEERISQARIKGIIDAQNALERLYAAQSAGFNGEGSNNSLQGSIDALEIAVRGAAARMGGL